MAFHNFSSGHGHAFHGEYLELVPDKLIRYTDEFDDPNLPGVLQVTVALEPVLCGTELRITQAGIPGPIPLEMCYLGWQESLAQLANLVEPQTGMTGAQTGPQVARRQGCASILASAISQSRSDTASGRSLLRREATM